MTQGKITASAAMLNVLKTWGVDTIYGIPSGTLSSLMDALAEDKDIRFLQVRHEETGALAAVMQAKFGGSIGVAVGSGGPGATHLINGIYEEKRSYFQSFSNAWSCLCRWLAFYFPKPSAGRKSRSKKNIYSIKPSDHFFPWLGLKQSCGKTYGQCSKRRWCD